MILKPIAALTAAACLACATESGERRAAADTTAADTAIQAVANTPAGGLEDWVRDIREGMRDVPSLAATDPVVAQRRALDLYVGRQEYIEMYWGPGRVLHSPERPELGEAVLAAEQVFHNVLQALAVQPIDTSRVRAGVDSLAWRLGRVVEIAKDAGVTLIPAGNRE